MRPLILDRALQIALAIHTAGITRSRREYQAFPFAHCRNRDCHELTTERYCPEHERTHKTAAARERARRARKDAA